MLWLMTVAAEVKSAASKGNSVIPLASEVSSRVRNSALVDSYVYRFSTAHPRNAA